MRPPRLAPTPPTHTVTSAFALVATLALALAACHGDLVPAESPPGDDDLLRSSSAAPGVDCRERRTTGYSNGYARPITVITVDGKAVERRTGNAYWLMKQAAARAGVGLRLISGFRSMAEQQYLYNCYTSCSCNSCNLAARPGYSNHQSGLALDLNTSAPGVYRWLAANAGRFGFGRTVPSEPWHWELVGAPPAGGPCQENVIGVLDSVAGGRVRGWACDTDRPARSVSVHLYVGGPAGAPATFARNIAADRPSEAAVGARCRGGSRHRFDLVISRAHCGKTVYAYAINVAGTPGANTLIGAKRMPACRPPIGWLERVSADGMVTGWACDRDAPSKSIGVHVYVGGPAGTPWARAFSITANRSHEPAVTWACGGGKAHRYHAPIPAKMRTRGLLVYAYGIDHFGGTNAMLQGSGKRIP